MKNCDIKREILVESGTFNMVTGKTKITKRQVVIVECDTPLFSEQEINTGICDACRRGYSVEKNKFANEEEKQRALNSAKPVFNCVLDVPTRTLNVTHNEKTVEIKYREQDFFDCWDTKEFYGNFYDIHILNDEDGWQVSIYKLESNGKQTYSEEATAVVNLEVNDGGGVPVNEYSSMGRNRGHTAREHR